MAIIDIRINCPGVEVADAIVEALLDRRLIAAANRHPEIFSRYVWKGERHMRTEIPLVVRTRADLFDAVASAVKAAHPYETPSITGVVIDHVSGDYSAWILETTADASG